MAKLPYMQFFTADWVGDTRPLSLAAKGAWIDILCILHASVTRGERTMSAVAWARSIGATADQAVACIDELANTQIADVVKDGHGNVTVRNRRMLREDLTREQNRQRKENQRVREQNKTVTPMSQEMSREKSRRCHADVTPYNLESRIQSTIPPYSPPRGTEGGAADKTVEKPPNQATPAGPDGRGVPGQRADAAAEAENADTDTAAGGTGSGDSVPATPFSEAGATSAQAPPEPPAKSPAKPPAKGPLQLRAEALMRRRPSTPLTDGETRAFRKNKAAIEATNEEDWKALETFYAAPQPETFARKDLATLVNNWNGEIDRAKAWAAAGGRANAQAPEKKRRAAFA